jgi:WD40 repeat protein
MAKLWDAETGELLNTFAGHENGVHVVAFNRDGTQLASGGRDGAVRIWKVERAKDKK